MKYLPITIFLISLLVIFFGINYYILYRATGFFTDLNHLWLYAIILSALFPLASLLERAAHSLPTRIFYIFSAIWIGFVFLLLVTLLLLEIINIFSPVFHNFMLGCTVIILVAALTLFSIINASHLVVKDVTVDGFGKNMTAVHISDIHIGSVRGKKFLSNIVDKTNNLNPDVVFITGDLVDGSRTISKSDIAPLKKIKAPIYFIMGNHDQYEGENSVAKLLEGTNITILRNEQTMFKGIQIIGLEYTESNNYVAEHLANMTINLSKPSILLNHAPTGYAAAKKAGITLELSGHTHGGQIFPFSLAAKLVHHKDNGLYKMGKFSLYVSQGTGTWGPPMRLGTTSEITLLHLEK